MKHIHEVQQQGLAWVNVTRQGEKELGEVERRFHFCADDIKESLPPFQRPKIVKRENYYFIVLHFPVFDRQTKRLSFTEIDFFLSGTQLVTVHDSKLLTIDHFFTECKKDAAALQKYFSGTAARIFFELLSRLLDAIFPILLHINDDINCVDKRLFSRTSGRQMAEEILRLKTNIVAFRRTMQGHRTVMERLIINGGRELDLPSFQNYINSLREYTVEIWHMLESQKESINALHETNESILSLRTNEVMKTLTIISVITFPLTLVATLFSINASGTPFIHNAYGFWVVALLMFFGAVFMAMVFKLRKWM